MPNSRSFRRVRLVWQRRARALRPRVRPISAAVRSRSALGGLRFNHQNGIKAATAVCTWHSVRPGFSPPELQPRPRQEQVAYTAQDQVAFQAPVTPPLVLVQADLGLLVLETPLHSPPRKGHEKHH